MSLGAMEGNGPCSAEFSKSMGHARLRALHTFLTKGVLSNLSYSVEGSGLWQTQLRGT